MKKTKTSYILKNRVPSNNGNSASSLFNDADYEFNQSVGQSEFDKIYNGKPSTLDKLSVDAEYNKPKHKKARREIDEKNNFLNDIEEELEIEQKKVRD